MLVLTWKKVWRRSEIRSSGGEEAGGIEGATVEPLVAPAIWDGREMQGERTEILSTFAMFFHGQSLLVPVEPLDGGSRP